MTNNHHIDLLNLRYITVAVTPYCFKSHTGYSETSARGFTA